MNKVLTLTAAALFATTGFALAQDVLVEVPQGARDYVIANPSDPVVLDDSVSQGYVVPERIVIHEIPDNPDFGYVYVNGRPVIVSMRSRQVVYLSESSKAVPDDAITYIERHPVDTVMIDGPVSSGTVIPGDVMLNDIPDQPRYSYVYVDQRPALIDRSTRRVVWVR
ncbi:DUF1236 domain-containing protein [Phyllobacterium sp. BT25]|uniref:DUF1236 domain-containing protein n=1 Tax=Phyllobacterium pellucidum TaxID=2740464 RepID=A0A849VQ53_9HYPH|nr:MULTISPECIES: DUF1236 domain-containing protein [Phyllobacterium]NTS30137.1 DUF1236 domain-containing protein [Phyllobacterium pellucidum]UGY11126.1 DUF1236 domain-containing protein [Phyllobacterium sp. T1018]SFI51556.1 Protein of unknown function [Phyllobacterium sp. CL33Tsu]